MLPNFLGLGAQKAGTTSLFEYLRSHSDIYLPPNKETAFFYHDYLYEKGLSYYSDHYFGGWKGQKAVGEISPHYLYHPFCCERIRKHLNNLNFIIMLRNPIDRAYSNYLMEVRRGRENLSFKEAIEKEPERIKKGLFEKDTYSYVQRGFYYEQIKMYMDRFDDSRFLFLLSEDLKNNRETTMKQVYRFLGVDKEINASFLEKEYHTASKMRFTWLYKFLTAPPPWSKTMTKALIPFKLRQDIKGFLYRYNKKTFTPPPVDMEIRLHLRKIFAESNKNLEKLIGKNLSHWK
ncbi:MAG: sulfotransferase [Candidatus Brocadiaceae bacterium]